MIRWTPELLDRALLPALVANPATHKLEHLPPLLSDECILGNSNAILKHVASNLRRGYTPQSEVLPMPRGFSGDRPVVYMDLTTRIAYAGLVALGQPALEPSSRQEAVREEFREIGTDESDPGYVVMSDIAACYEYIVPQILIDELFLRSDDYELVDNLAALLQALATLGRGIPQMLEASDHLADLYLSIVDRALNRAGLRWARTADDYKIVVPTWSEASAALALLDREVRAVGLILSANKTRIVAVGAKARTRSSSSPESDDELEIEDEEEEEEPVEALLGWHREWRAARRNNRIIDPPPTRELRILKSSDGVTVDLLADLVFAYPPHLEYVVGVINRFAEASPNDDALAVEVFDKLLTQVPRTSWNVLWLLEAASHLAGLNRLGNLPQAKPLAEAGLTDTAELVRVQSAWFMARFYSLTSAQLQSLHLHASRLTITGVSAIATVAAAKAKARDKDTFIRAAGAIRGRQPLNDLAAEWAKSHV